MGGKSSKDTSENTQLSDSVPKNSCTLPESVSTKDVKRIVKIDILNI